MQSKKEENWLTIKEFINQALDGNEIKTTVEFMKVYDAAYNLETGNFNSIDDLNKYFYEIFSNGQAIHSLRVEIIKLIRIHCQNNPNESYQQFRKKWENVSKNRFSYHQRHFLKRVEQTRINIKEKKLQNLPPPPLNFKNDTIDDNTKSIFELGLLVWNDCHKK